MKFLYVYIIFGAVIPIAIAGILLLLAYLLAKYLSKRNYSAIVSITPIFCWFIVFLLSIFLLSAGFERPLGAIFQYRNTKYTTTGYITDITDANTVPIYYDSVSHNWSTGKYVIINGQDYYMPYGDVKIGSAVTLVWGSDQRVVYDYSLEKTITADKIGTYPIINDTEKPMNTNYKKAGQLIISVFLATFSMMVLSLHFAKNHVRNYLIKQDNEIINRIIPNKLGLIYNISICTHLFGIGLGCALGGFKEALFFCLVFIFLIVASKIGKMRTELTICDDYIEVMEGKRIRLYSIRDIKNVSFKNTRLPYNRCLVIYFYSGCELAFSQLDFWGLDSVYRYLTHRLAQGDGLREPLSPSFVDS